MSKIIDLSNTNYFKYPAYNQKEYWDLRHNILGKRENRSWVLKDNNFNSNLTLTAYIDGGDTAQRLGMYYTGLRLLEKNGYKVNNFYRYDKRSQESLLELLYCSWTWGLYRRHPEPKEWYSDQYRGSRDNIKSIISAESFLTTKSSFKRVGLYILRHLFFRLGLFDAKTKQNGSKIACHGTTCDYSFKFPTLTGPTVWASYIRYAISRNKIFYVLYPFLLLFDLEIVINSIIKQNLKVKKFYSEEKVLDNDVSNHVIYSCWFAYIAPTPLIWFMNKYLNSKSHFISMLYSYHDNGTESITLPIMWEHLINIYFKKD